MITFLRTTAVALSICATVSAWAADGVAFLTNLKGEAVMDDGLRPLLMAELRKGQKIRVAKDAAISVMFIQSGKEFVLNGPGEYAIDATEVIVSKGAKPTMRQTEWRTSTQALVKVAQTSSASVRMRSIAPPKAEAPALTYPTLGLISNLQPTFRWTDGEGKATEIAISVAAEPEKVAHRAALSSDSYRLPVKLQPGTDYIWAVTAGGREMGRASFKTPGIAMLTQIEKRKPAAKAEFSDRLLYALFLHDLGAVQDAKLIWAELAATRSDLPELAAMGKPR